MSAKKPLQAGALLMASVLGCVLVFELFLRVFLPVPFQPPVREWKAQDIPGLKPKILFEENAWGIRSLSMRTLEKPAGTRRVLALGASTTAQVNQGTEDTWTGILERKLNSEFDLGRIEVLAYGQGGKTASFRIARLEALLEQVEPDVLVTLEGINDMALHGGPGYRYAGPESLFLIEDRFHSLPWRCRKRFQLCRRLKAAELALKIQWASFTGEALSFEPESVSDLQATYRKIERTEVPPRDPDPYDEFVDAMGAMLDLAKRRGLPVVVLGQPVLWKPEMTRAELDSLWIWVATSDGRARPAPAWLQAEMTRYNEAQRAAAEARGFTFVDLDRHLPKTTEVFFDDCHLTDRGSRLQAELVTATVAASLAGRPGS